MQKIYRIPSTLYYYIFQNGIDKGIDADKLISVYATLKVNADKHSKYYAFTSKNNKTVTNYSLLRNKTNISLITLKKYIPILIELELCFFEENGDFVMLGKNNIDNIKKTKKLVPIQIGKNIINTAYNVYFVRLHSTELKQNKAIEKKHNQRELLKRKDNPRSLKELKLIKKLERKTSSDSFDIDKSVLSILSYSFLKCNEEKKHKGCYWKNKMIKKNLIVTKRRFKIIDKISFTGYVNFKKFSDNKDLTKKLVYINGYLCEELVSEISTKVSVKN
jgi:hypothetical protein